MSEEMLTAKELMEGGYLQEANRRFFHPLGLAMFVNVNNGSVGVLRDDDPEGWRYEGELLDEAPAKARKVQEEIDQKRPVREAALGYWIQPLEWTEEELAAAKAEGKRMAALLQGTGEES